MMKVAKVISVRRYNAGYEIREEMWDSGGQKPILMRAAYTPNGDYIGSAKTARQLVAKRGIQPQKAHPSHCVCSIGYSVKNGRWYGWSHRAIYGFRVGSRVKKGDCGYVPKSQGGKGDWIAKTTTDAKQMAIDFAESVS
jgi:hypothetical protein